jgi:hypothetical protein
VIPKKEACAAVALDRGRFPGSSRLLKECILIPLIFVLVACASAFNDLKRVEPGITFAEVEAVMGHRDVSKSVRSEGSLYELYRYENRLCSPNLSFWDRCDFLVIFRNGKVAETGVKEGRSYSPDMAFLSLFQAP